MKFRRNANDEMVLVKKRNVLDEMREVAPISTVYVVDIPIIKESIKKTDFLKGKVLSVTPMLAVTVATGGSGVFWDAFMQYIFPWLMDIAKVFCAIKIAQAFYEEKRGGREGGTGMGAFVTYGKWYLLLALMPWAVELIDELSKVMLTDLRTKGT